MKTIADHSIKGIRLDFRTTENQQFYSQWENRNIIVKYAGRCAVCNNTVYQPLSEKGHPYDPDPRGIFVQEHAAAHLIASEYSMTGPDVPLCFECSNTHEKYEKGLAIARDRWKGVQS